MKDKEANRTGIQGIFTGVMWILIHFDGINYQKSWISRCKYEYFNETPCLKQENQGQLRDFRNFTSKLEAIIRNWTIFHYK